MICPRCEEEYTGTCPAMEQAFAGILADQGKPMNGTPRADLIVISSGWIEGGLCEKDHRHD